MKLTFSVKKNTDQVFEYLSDMQKFVSVHPVITRMDDLQNNRYLVHETLKIWFIPYTFTYNATVEKRENEKTITIRATVFRLTKITMHFSISANQDQTIIEENIEFKTLLPIQPILKKVFSKQHRKLFNNIDLAS